MWNWISELDWQAWAMIGTVAVFIPYFILVATGRLTKARTKK
jgi:uncharacterized protein YaaW (UPF0174 family)